MLRRFTTATTVTPFVTSRGSSLPQRQPTGALASLGTHPTSVATAVSAFRHDLGTPAHRRQRGNPGYIDLNIDMNTGDRRLAGPQYVSRHNEGGRWGASPVIRFGMLLVVLQCVHALTR